MLAVFSFGFSDVSDQQSVYGIRSKTFFTDKEINKWHHFATVYSTKQKLRRYYINGEENTEDDKGTVPGNSVPQELGLGTAVTGTGSATLTNWFSLMSP